MVFPDSSVHFTSKPDYHIAEYPVIHVQASFPYDLARVYAEGISLLDMVIQHGGQQIIRGSDRMKIPGKMKV